MQFIQPGPYPSASKAGQHYLTGFLNYLAKHGPQQRIEVDPAEEAGLANENRLDVREFRVGPRTVEAKITDVWVEVIHVYVWDRVIVGKGEPDANGHVVQKTQNKLVLSTAV